MERLATNSSAATPAARAIQAASKRGSPSWADAVVDSAASAAAAQGEEVGHVLRESAAKFMYIMAAVRSDGQVPRARSAPRVRSAPRSLSRSKAAAHACPHAAFLRCAVRRWPDEAPCRPSDAPMSRPTPTTCCAPFNASLPRS